MKKENFYDVVVIGGGPAGLTAALYLARACYRVLVIEKEKFGGQITITDEVVNYPGVEKTSGKELTETMRRQAENFGAEFLLGEVSELKKAEITPGADIWETITDKGRYQSFGVLLATGAHPRMIGFPGEAEFRGHGVAYCATCDGMLYKDKKIAVFCDNADGEEEVEYLSDLASEVYYSHKLTSKIDKANVTHLKSRITAVIGDSKVSGIELADGTNLDVDGVFFIKQAVSADVLLNKLEVQNGSIVVDKNMKTSIDGCFAAGDCTGTPYQIAKAVGEGNIAAHSAVKYLSAQDS